MQTNVAPQEIPDKNKNNSYTKDISKWSKDKSCNCERFHNIRNWGRSNDNKHKVKVQFLRGGAIADITSTIYPI